MNTRPGVRLLVVFGLTVLAAATSAPAQTPAAQQCTPSPTCTPPATYRPANPQSTVDFNVLVKYAGDERKSGTVVYWIYVKAEQSRACTAKELATWPRECRAKVGDVFFVTPPFKMVPVK